MSVYSSGTGQYLYRNTALITTGDFSIGMWFKFLDDLDRYTDILNLQDAVQDPSYYYLYVDTFTDGTAVYAGEHPSEYECATYTISLDSWYYMVLSRSGTTTTFRIFDDSTSTTPLSNQNLAGTITGNLTNHNYFVISQGWTGEGGDIEFTCARVVTGDAWTNAECRNESQSYTWVTGNGTLRGNWKLMNIGATTDGIYDSSGNGYNLTNESMTTGASDPSQLSSTSVMSHWCSDVWEGP